MAFGPRERTIFKFAQAQHGLVTYAQLAEAGVSRSLLQLRLRSGEWVRELRSLVRMHWAERTWMQRAWAAWLWAGPLSVVSHFSAGVLNGLAVAADEPIYVTLPARFRVVRPAAWVRPYRSRNMLPREVETLGGLPVTRPARTLIDLAALLSEPALVDLVQAGLRLGTFRLGELQEYFNKERTQGRGGATVLRRVLCALGKRS